MIAVGRDLFRFGGHYFTHGEVIVDGQPMLWSANGDSAAVNDPPAEVEEFTMTLDPDRLQPGDRFAASFDQDNFRGG